MSAIINPFSAVFNYTKLYPVPAHQPNESRPQAVLKPNTFQNITPRDRWDLTNQSRVLYGAIPMVAAAIEARARFAFANGCFIKSHSLNKDFAAAQESGINEVFYRDPNLLGDNHDMHSTLIELSINLERDGGQAAVFDPESGKFMVIPTTLIGNGFGLKDVGATGELSALSNKPAEMSYWGLGPGGYVTYGSYIYGYQVIIDKASPYYGARIIDGFIVDRNRQRLAVRVMGFNSDGDPAYQDIAAENIRVDFKTTWSDQIGFVPQLATAIMSIVNVQDFDYYIKQAMILAAQKAVTRKSRDGKAPGTDGVGYTFINPTTGAPDATNPGEQPPAGASRIMAYEVNGAGMVELSTDNNEEIGTVPFERPSLNEEQFIERIERGYLYRIWPYDMIYAKASNRAAARAQGQQVKMNIWEEQRQGEKFLRWAINQRTAWDMARGNLPRNNAGADPYNYEIVWPAEYSTDEGYDAKIALDRLGRNLTSHRRLAGAAGDAHDKIQKENLDYSFALLAEVAARKKNNPDLADIPTLQLAQMIDNFGANLNGQVAPPNGPAKPAPEPGNPNKTPGDGEPPED